jgi:hypothetical protein
MRTTLKNITSECEIRNSTTTLSTGLHDREMHRDVRVNTLMSHFMSVDSSDSHSELKDSDFILAY